MDRDDMLEIERRFLCRVTDEAALRRAARASRIRQGYLSLTEPAVRVRERDGAWLFTAKSGRGRVRREVEFPLDGAAGAALLEMAGQHVLEKERLAVGGWEVDLFRGKLDGLVVAEAELEREDDPLPAPPPGVTLLDEITDAGGWTNQRLAALGTDEAKRLVARLAGG